MAKVLGALKVFVSILKNDDDRALLMKGRERSVKGRG
jgi:hypothetical protein